MNPCLRIFLLKMGTIFGFSEMFFFLHYNIWFLECLFYISCIHNLLYSGYAFYERESVIFIYRLLCGVAWHTGKVLACDAVGLRFNSWQGHGIL